MKRSRGGAATDISLGREPQDPREENTGSRSALPAGVAVAPLAGLPDHLARLARRRLPAQALLQRIPQVEAAAGESTLAGLEAKWATWLNGANLPQYAGLTGDDLLETIMNEKYIALAQNPQIWNDWKRTGYPELTTANNLELPRRFMYPDSEENTNENFPGVLGLYARNDNDPN